MHTSYWQKRIWTRQKRQLNFQLNQAAWREEHLVANLEWTADGIGGNTGTQVLTWGFHHVESTSCAFRYAWHATNHKSFWKGNFIQICFKSYSWEEWDRCAPNQPLINETITDWISGNPLKLYSQFHGKHINWTICTFKQTSGHATP